MNIVVENKDIKEKIALKVEKDIDKIKGFLYDEKYILFNIFILVFLYHPSIFLLGIYNKYAINTPIKNGLITLKKLLTILDIWLKLSNNL